MKRPVKLIGRMLDAVQRRFRRARPGSVLIMVVSLLVLLALIGTAAISTARLDRADSQQNVANVQVDLLAEGVKQMVVGQLVNDLFGYATFNMTDSAGTDPDAGTTDTRDAMLGSRLPERLMTLDEGVYPTNSVPNPTRFETNVIPTAVNAPCWRYISYPPIQNGLPFKFDVPTEDSSDPAVYVLPLPKPLMTPTTVTINGQTYPALQGVTVRNEKLDPTNVLRANNPFLAGDADGDGVAESVLFKLPVSPLGGVTYYATVRVIDGGSAINVNTARDASSEVESVAIRGAGTPAISFAGMYPASITLPTNMTQKEFDRLEMQRYQGSFPRPTSTTPPTAMNLGVLKSPYADLPNASPYAINPTARDFVFLTPGDMLHNQLGRRLDYPGSYDDRTRFGGGSRPFGIGDSMTLAYAFTLVNSTAYDSTIEAALTPSVIDLYLTGAPTSSNPPKTNVSPYQPGRSDDWFAWNFDYFPASYPLPATPSTPLPGQIASNRDKQFPRPYLTSFNPVRNTVPRIYSTAVVNTGNPTLSTPEKYPTKSNINTADFDELWHGFREVMSSAVDATPFNDAAAADVEDAYWGMHFKPADYGVLEENHPARMFRSPLRPVPGVTDAPSPAPVLHPGQMLRIRSALAALNTLAIRNPASVGNNVILGSAVISLPLPAGVTQTKFKDTYKAILFGAVRQPYITEVYVDNNPELQVRMKDSDKEIEPDAEMLKNPNGFAAIELYNPYDTELDLTGWRLRIIDRDKFPNLILRRLDDDPSMPPTGGEPGLSFTPPEGDAGMIIGKIPPHGYMVIWNYVKGASDADPDAAQYIPNALKPKIGEPALQDKLVDGGVKVVTIKQLHRIIGKEIVLMRPAQVASATVGGPPQPILAPMDSFDCSGLLHNTFTQGKPVSPVTAWHYVRANDPNTRAWHFVYPGRYQASEESTNANPPSRSVGRRHQGTNFVDWDPTPTGNPTDWKDDDPNAPIIMGRASIRQAHLTNSREGLNPNLDIVASFPIQLANADTDFQFRVGGKRAFPINGGFARAGDVLQVPYIGSYVIVDTDPPALPDIPKGWQPYVEVNAVTMDAAMAEDTDIYDDWTTDANGDTIFLEDVGRFSPIVGAPVDFGARKAFGTLTAVTSPSPSTVEDNKGVAGNEQTSFWEGYDIVVTNFDTTTPGAWKQQIRRVTRYTTGGKFEVYPDFDPPLVKPDPTKPNEVYPYKLQRVRYEWGARVLDYFTAIHAAGDDFLPNRNKDDNLLGMTSAPDPVRNVGDPSRSVNRVGTTTTPRTQTEDDVPVEGLININTANWKVLASLPLVMLASDPTKVDPILTERLAKRIVYYRDIDDGNGPYDPSTSKQTPHPHGKFNSIMELATIPRFVNAEETMPFANNKHDGMNLIVWGDYSTMTDDPRGDHVPYDFEKKYLNLTRLSNLLTTRSDCFTVYLQVQGWRDAGTSNAKIVAQRRLAFIVDRSRLTATQRSPAIYNLPVPAAQ